MEKKPDKPITREDVLKFYQVGIPKPVSPAKKDPAMLERQAR